MEGAGRGNQLTRYGAIATVLPELAPSAKVFFVGDNTDSWFASFQKEFPPDREGTDRIYATIDAAIGACVAGRGDVILVAPGHAETLTAASAITCDIAGVTIIGLGSGSARPTLTFGTAVGASVVISAAGVKIRNIVGVANIDGLTNPFHVQAADCELDIEWQDGSATVEAVRVVLTTAAADRLKVNLVYRGFTAGDACVNAVRLVGCNDGRINVEFYGKASTGVVEFITTACTNINVTGWFYNSGTTDFSKNVVDTQASSTWSLNGYDAAAGRPVAGGSGRALYEPGSPLGKRVSRATADVFTGAAVPIFTIAGGRVIITAIIGEVTTVIGAGVNNFKLQSNPTTGATTDLAANLDIDADEVGTLYSITGTPTDALVRGESGSVRNMAVNGVVIPIGQIEVLSAGNVTGSAKFDVWYIPLDDGATVVAA